MKPEKFILKRVKPKTRAKGWKPVTIKLDLYEQLMEISDTTDIQQTTFDDKMYS